MDEPLRYLSRDIGELQQHYTVVVVGSGYGAAIAASRLARASQQVCVLERGREILPGDYPNTWLTAEAEMQFDTPSGPLGHENGLYDFRLNDDISVFLGCGLGGTSLVNAGVFKRAADQVFKDKRWPSEFQTDCDGIEEGYRRAEEMLKPARYPDSGPTLPKVKAMRIVANALDLPFEKPPVNVNFTVDGSNHVGVIQHRCERCGDCVTGCNYWAKNTLLMNYLPDAWNYGAHIFTETEVRHLERKEGKWTLHLRDRRSSRLRRQAAAQSVSADIVVLGAGALGSTEILKRSEQKGLSLSAQLGERFTGNGDFLAFGIRTEPEIRGVGFGPRRPEHLPPVGPTISTLINGRDTPDFNDGIVIEEGVIPGALMYPAGLRLTLQAALDASPDDKSLKAFVHSPEGQRIGLIEPFAGMWRHVITYLGMAHDSGDGQLCLRDDRIRIRWPGVGQQPVFQRMDALLRRATKSLGGRHVKIPEWHEPSTHMTVHPLGGCVMGEDAERGVVNHKGEVFAGTAGTAVHDGLYVCDGAVIPRPLGVNPLMTISAVAERTVALLADKQNWKIDYEVSPPSKPPGKLRPLGLQFTESMRGEYSTSVLKDFPHPEASEAWQSTSPFEFTLTVLWDDLERVLADPAAVASLTGTVTAPALSPEPMTVTDGVFNLFIPDPTRVNSRRMHYRITLETRAGQQFHVEGLKLIHDDPGFDLWADTTTLYATVHDGPTPAGPILGLAVLRMLPEDFLRQIATIEVLNAPSRRAEREAAAKFVRLFLGALFDAYAGAWGRPVLSDPRLPPRLHRPLRLPQAKRQFVTTNDGVQIGLTRYRGGDKGPVILTPGFGTSTVAFLLDTIETNLTEFLYEHGYDIWLFDYRGSSDLPAAPTQFTLDDIAMRDYPAAIEHVREQTDGRGVQVMGHCVGSVTLLMSLLSGLTGVRSAICSQFTVHVDQPGIQQLKAAIRLPDIVQGVGIDYMTPSVNAETFGEIDRVLDTFLRVTSKHETCDSPVCRRILFMYGEVYRHDQLNDATHRAIHEMFGTANMKTFQHLARVVREGRAVDSAGSDVYLPRVGNLRSTPISFIQGKENHLFHPSGSKRTYDWLCEANGPKGYTHRVIPEYGHMDCFIGRDSAKDVFPVILQELERA